LNVCDSIFAVFNDSKYHVSTWTTLNVADRIDSDMFSLRIVSADHYMAEPCPGLDMVSSEFRSTKIFKLPVIRLYGPTRLG